MTENDRFEQAWAILSGFFPNSFIIVKDGDQKMLRWRSNDHTWAVGACHRYLEAGKQDDWIDREDQIS